MSRLRLLRVVLPVLLLALAWLLWRSWEPRQPPRAHPPDSQNGIRAQDLSFTEFQGSSSSIAGHADLVQPGPDGRMHLEGVRDLAMLRPGENPIVISAGRGDRVGSDGAWRWHFEGEVVFKVDEQGLRLVLPSLEYDQSAGEARSTGDIRFDAPGARGSAESLVYGLSGQPGQLTQPKIEYSTGGQLSADQLRLIDGVRDVELSGAVRATKADLTLEAARLRLVRPEGQLRRAEATGDVVGSGMDGAALRCTDLVVTWDAQGDAERVELTGNASVTRGAQSIEAPHILASREGLSSTDSRIWKVQADDDVHLKGQLAQAPGLLHAEHVEVTLDPQMAFNAGQAIGRVTFEGQDTRGEAELATFRAEAGEWRIELHGTGVRKAGLAYGTTRVAADSIVTDARGRRLLAEDRVEATLLPGATGQPSPVHGRLFVPRQAVHFVSAKLLSEGGGSHLVFTGGVRAWQGERNLAAERVVVDEQAHSIEAATGVTARMPRRSVAPVLSEADYLQIAAEDLVYRDDTGLAVFRGKVRVGLLEGWLEAQQVEIELTADTRAVGELRASGEVRLELQRSSKGDLVRPVSAGADRVVYRPGEQHLRLYGQQAPASVRRIGPGGGTTTGQVLTYHLDSGTLDVDSGDQAPGRIRTGGP